MRDFKFRAEGDSLKGFRFLCASAFASLPVREQISCLSSLYREDGFRPVERTRSEERPSLRKQSS